MPDEPIRIINIIRTLEKLPKPEYPGEIYRTIILQESWERFLNHMEDQKNITKIKEIVVKAERYKSRGREWLEWVLVDIKH